MAASNPWNSKRGDWGCAYWRRLDDVVLSVMQSPGKRAYWRIMFPGRTINTTHLPPLIILDGIQETVGKALKRVTEVFVEKRKWIKG